VNSLTAANKWQKELDDMFSDTDIVHKCDEDNNRIAIAYNCNKMITNRINTRCGVLGPCNCQ